MESCPSCDFCEVMPDGTLMCAIRDEQTHGWDWCRDWQAMARLVDGDDILAEGDYWHE